MRKVMNLLKTGMLMAVLLMCLTACGKKIDVTETLFLNYSGANGYGIAELDNEYGWENAALKEAGIEEIDTFSDLGDAYIIESAVTYEVSPKENLSNGDKIIVTAFINDDKIKPYKLKLVAKERTFIVEGLPEVKKLDLFENIDVIFQGVAPYVTATVVDGNAEHYVYTQYVLDVNSELDVGDTVNVTAKYDAKELIEMGYQSESDIKKFTVSGVPKYITSLSEVPKEADEQLKKQTEDVIKAEMAKWDSYSLNELTYLGNYFLTAKSRNEWNAQNYLYEVYKVVLSGKEEITFYYCIGYFDISLTEDGNCVYDFNKSEKPRSYVQRGWAFITGYEDIDKMFNQVVTTRLADYEYESTVTASE